jgi:ABC-2 type transport system ATP-binding protein
MIETRGLTKTFDKSVAVCMLDLTVKPGSIHGFLGMNGAGKSTTIRAIMGHIHPSAGQVLTLGSNPWKHSEEQRRRVAYVWENMELPGWMTPRDAVQFRSAFYPEWNHELCRTLLNDFGLISEAAFHALSKGKKRLLCILLALCQNADLLVMDEPASGLDVVARRELLDRILDIACDGNRTVFLSSHLLSDLERVVDQVTFISQGTKLIEGGLDQLKQSIRDIHLSGSFERSDLEQHFQVIQYERDENGVDAIIVDYDEERFRAFCTKYSCPDNVDVNGFNLEDLFVTLEKNRDGLINADMEAVQ